MTRNCCFRLAARAGRVNWFRSHPSLPQMRQRDVLIHHPLPESRWRFGIFCVKRWNDPQVVAIKQTIYRTGSDPVLMELLREAVRRGKGIMAVVERRPGLMGRPTSTGRKHWSRSVPRWSTAFGVEDDAKCCW